MNLAAFVKWFTIPFLFSVFLAWFALSVDKYPPDQNFRVACVFIGVGFVVSIYIGVDQAKHGD